MTTTDQATTDETPTEQTAAPAEPDTTTDEGSDKKSTSAEAAKYRTRLRDTETERDSLAERVESLQRAEVERLTEASRLKAAAFWAAGHELGDLLDDSGLVDGDKVAAAIEDARGTLGIPDPRLSMVVPGEGSIPNRSRAGGRDTMADIVAGQNEQ